MSKTDTARFISLDDLANMPPPQWLVEGLFEKNALVMLAGAPGAFKSFLLLDWLLCMASGRKWQGRTTVPSKVAYALGEGKASLLKRINAWLTHNTLTKSEHEALLLNFKVTFDVPQLGSKASVDNFLADIEAEGFKPEVIAVDTFARSFVGLDENDAKDTGLWVEQADRLRQIGYSVIFLHHTKKNTEFGAQYRGSTAIMGAMDTAMTLTREDNSCTLTTTKQKDHDEGSPIRFRKLPVGRGDEESCVLISAPSIDSRFSEENPKAVNINTLTNDLLWDNTYKSDSDRARKLADVSGMSFENAKAKLSRTRKSFVTDHTQP